MLDKARQGGAALIASGLPLLVIALWIVSYFLLACGYLGDPSAFNSDNLLSSAQCDDLLHGRDVTDWHLPGAPYVFPDLLLLLPCQWLAPSLPLAFLAYCLLLHLSLTASLTWLGCLSGLRLRTAMTAAGCGAILLAVMSVHKPMSDRACLLVHPGSHLAGLVVGIFLLALTLRLLKSPSWRVGLLHVLVAVPGCFSDRLVIVQVLAPLALALLLLAAGRVLDRKSVGVQLALLAVSVLLSWLLQWLFQRLGFHLLALDTAPGRLHLPDLFSMVRRLYQDIAADALLCALIPLHLFAALLIVWCGFRRPLNSSDEMVSRRPAVLLAALTFLLSPPCLVGTLFVLGMSHHPAVNRYTLSCWYLPPLLLPLLLCWLPGRAARMLSVVLQGSILIFAIQRGAVLLPGIDRTWFEQPYPPLARVLDDLARKHGPLNGLGSFWAARSTTWFAREKVVVNALAPMGFPYFHASNPARFLLDGEMGIPSYHFLVLRHGDPFSPNPGVLAVLYGLPRERIAVGADEIWLYDSLRTPPLDRFLRARLADRLHRKKPFIGPSEPACLAQPKRNMTPVNAAGTVALEPGQTCEVRFAQPITGRVLDVGAGAEASLDVDFYRGAEHLGSMAVPNVPWTGACYEKPGLQSRLLPLPSGLSSRTWDRLVVRARHDSDGARLGHVLVFADSIAGLDEERPLPQLQRIRLEAEELLPINPGTPFTDEADATASGGRVRRAAVDYRCNITYTPNLFLPPGRYRLECRLKVADNSSAEAVVTLLAGSLAPSEKWAERSLCGRDFAAAGRWTTRQMTFEVCEEAENVQLGITGLGKSAITVDYLDLIAEPSPPSAARRQQQQ